MTPHVIIKEQRTSWTSKIPLLVDREEKEWKRERKASLRAKENPEKLEQLLPGIPDEVSLKFIVPKFPWKVFHILSSTSRAWRRAIQNREIYNARVRSHATETLVALHSGTQIVLYSMRDNCFVELPPIPPKDLYWNPDSWRCVSVDGKLYMFGERKELSELSGRATTNFTIVDVYVLDLTKSLTRQAAKWKRCGSMQEPRYGFFPGQRLGYGAKDGKLYVFRPKFSSEDRELRTLERFVFYPGFTSEVFDFKSHAWSPRKPMLTKRYNYRVATLGDEFLVHGGMNSDETDAESFEVYNPLKDEWRIVGRVEHPRFQLFIAQGKIYGMDGFRIAVYNSEQQLWTPLYSCSYHSIGKGVLFPIAVAAANDELIAIVTNLSGGPSWRFTGSWYWGDNYLVRSRGFGSDKSDIVWEEVKLPISFAKMMNRVDLKDYLITPIQL